MTAGGSNDADIATPTKLLIFVVRLETATPTPDGIAMKAPIHNPLNNPLLVISADGHESVPVFTPFWLTKAVGIPHINPVKIQINKRSKAFKIASLTKSHLRITVQNVPPRIGF